MATGVSLSTKLAGENQTLDRMQTAPNYTPLNIPAGTATTVVKSGAGLFHTLTINTKGASSNVITVYDNTAASGTLIATIDGTTGPITYLYDVAFATGLTVKSTTGTGADMTVAYL